MPPRTHLPLHRLQTTQPRRARPGFGSDTGRSPSAHGAKIGRQIDAVQADQADRVPIPGINPELILKVQLTRPADEDAWRSAGFTVIAQNPGNVFVLFADNTELTRFKEMLAAYQGGVQGTAKSAPNSNLFDTIEEAKTVGAADRIGDRLKGSGITALVNIKDGDPYVVDIELWDPGGDLTARQARAQSVAAFIEGLPGTIFGTPFITSYGLIVLRARVLGAALKTLLDRPEVALVDLPPLPDLGDRDPPSLTIHELPALAPPAFDAPLIGIIDSGINAHPLLEGVVVDSVGVPPALGTADDRGHGTKVAGIAVFGDVRERIESGQFAAPARVISVRVTNANGGFDDTATIAEQMREAITLLADRGCRVINMSLGDKTLQPYAGGRASSWASTLDNLARERNLVIVVSSGNTAAGANAPWGDSSDAILTSYPRYLTTPENRLIDPAIGANILTVAAIAHGNGLLNEGDGDGPQVQAITEAGEPSPISRTGPGINDAIKPDLCDFGGTLVFDGHSGQLKRGAQWASAGMLTLSPDYLRSLFTAETGTSFAAPRVAYKAALLFARWPTASANMVRALLAISARVPPETVTRLASMEPNKAKLQECVRQCVGYGMPEAAYALASDDSRVVLVADNQTLDLDQVALYAVPLPDEYRLTRGRRSIRVSLAFDPPVRHTRSEYLGARMSFRLVRNMTPEAIFEHYRKRPRKEAVPELGSAADCTMQPGPNARDTGTLQCATFTQIAETSRTEDTIYVVVRTYERWAGDMMVDQRFALAVELNYDGCATLYQSCSELNVVLRARIDLPA